MPTAFRALDKPAGTRRGAFRTPEPWVADGGATQRVTRHRGATDVVIGLDFGTSFTKAAVGLQDKIFPVTWEGVSRFAPGYLLPSEFSQLAGGSVYLGQHSRAAPEQVHADLKLPFINAAHVDEFALARASTFLAMVLRYVRAFVFHHHGGKLASAKIRWHLNIGAPCNGLEDADTVFTYTLLARSAWRRSLGADVRRVGDFAPQETTDGVDLVSLEVKPEFVAQLAAYVQSPQRQAGLHALVDVGGGTLDVVTFNVHQKDGEDTFPFFVPQVRPLGTHGLLQNRLLAAGVSARQTPLDELAPVPSATEFAALAGIPAGPVVQRDELFRDAVKSCVGQVLELTKRRRYRLSEAWRLGVRTFFTGGGSSVDLYEKALQTTRTPSTRPLNIIPLPMHPRLDGFDAGVREYQRISVACGLAQDAWTLGRIVPAREVDDDLPLHLGPARERPDRDDLYSK